ncbi:MAG: hypothetical protein SPI06_06990 [Terrisporobacter sp.]|uniref:hypothetical protein n=1 Tax=Terrisporobacter sp. TaxID=1965305 RepID=UPI002A90B06E|nr:hypothetical protein [Terrisporobacter sp.]MDY6153139.1 hypothetical protein [Terrisporobacter sp.]
MLKKLMSGIVIGSMVLSMVGCSSNEQPKEQVYIIKHVDSQGNETKEQVTKQEYDKQVKEAKEAGKKVTTETKDTTKEEVKKDTTKKEQNDNIDPETGLAKVKHGTHLQEEADKQEEDYGIWTKDYCPECGQPMDDCICNGDTDPDIDYSNTQIYDDYQEPDEFKQEDEPTVKYYGINGKEQTKEEWYRDYKYINKGYNSHIDDDDNVYWTDEDGNEYR